MKILLSGIIFIIVLFFYLHVFYHLKTSNDLEVYTISQPSKMKLEEVCDIRQPVMFETDILKYCGYSDVAAQFSAFDVKIREVGASDVGLPLKLENALQLTTTEEKLYYSDGNGDFLEETGLVKEYKYNDSFIKPPFVARCEYDYMFGSVNATTHLQYQLNYRNYFYVSQGSVTVKMAPPKYTKYLYPVYDYENFSFYSPVNLWNVQGKYRSDYDKMKCVEIKVNSGSILFIPAYWWYSIRFDEPSTSICVFKYRTYMNVVAILPELSMCLLQNQNVKRKIVSTAIKNKNPVEKTTVDNMPVGLPEPSNVGEESSFLM